MCFTWPWLVQPCSTTVAATCGTDFTYVGLPLDEKKTSNHQPREMRLRHRGYNSQWMVVIFFPPPFTTKNYQVLHVSKLDGVISINHWYPMAVNAIWLPHSMDAVVGMMKEGKLAQRLFLHHP